VNDPEQARRDAARVLGLSQLRADPLYPRLPSHRREELVAAALEDGYALAERIRRQWGGDPAAIAAQFDVPVTHSTDDAGFGSVVVYAHYYARPPRITLYLPAIERLDRQVEQAGRAQFGGMRATLPIFLAHELYHHIDCRRGTARLSRRHAVALFGVGRWQWTARLSSLPEIAAGAFAQRLLDLPFHPGRLDELTRRTQDS
jgi:hypothetical protein